MDSRPLVERLTGFDVGPLGEPWEVVEGTDGWVHQRPGCSRSVGPVRSSLPLVVLERLCPACERIPLERLNLLRWWERTLSAAAVLRRDLAGARSDRSSPSARGCLLTSSTWVSTRAFTDAFSGARFATEEVLSQLRPLLGEAGSLLGSPLPLSPAVRLELAQLAWSAPAVPSGTAPLSLVLSLRSELPRLPPDLAAVRVGTLLGPPPPPVLVWLHPGWENVRPGLPEAFLRGLCSVLASRSDGCALLVSVPAEALTACPRSDHLLPLGPLLSSDSQEVADTAATLLSDLFGSARTVPRGAPSPLEVLAAARSLARLAPTAPPAP